MLTGLGAVGKASRVVPVDLGAGCPAAKHWEDLHIYDVDLWCKWFGHFEDFAVKKFSIVDFWVISYF